MGQGNAERAAAAARAAEVGDLFTVLGALPGELAGTPDMTEYVTVMPTRRVYVIRHDASSGSIASRNSMRTVIMTFSSQVLDPRWLQDIVEMMGYRCQVEVNTTDPSQCKLFVYNIGPIWPEPID
jgi:hypothetical protein